ncbi:hypothetical protein [Dactylosporangium roseum]|uniref:hypothetical protein n=1 Tax=Dactylosporangium roseum TaxID=47989 RepID=UPI0021B2F91F|nr:hypothetical protein [Dactylosporangium roseum]
MPVPLPSCPPGVDPSVLVGEIHAWATSEPLRALVAAFGGRIPEDDTAAVLAWLDAFSAAHWDFRAGRERDEVPTPMLADGVGALVAASAAALRLTDTTAPPHRSYEHLLILGGLGRACLQRTEHAARLVRSGEVTAGEVTALASFRPLTDTERALPGLAGLGHEIDAVEAGVRAAFGFAGPPGGSVSVRTFPGVRVLAAPSGDPRRRRANTADTYEFWAGLVHLRPGDRILVVTSPVYVPFQHCDAIRLVGLPYRCGVDTVGFAPTRASVPQPPEAARPDRYLQEVRSTILAMRRLVDVAG